MKNEEKILMVIVVVILLCVVIFVAQKVKKPKIETTNNISGGSTYVPEDYVKTTDDGTRVNTSSKMAEKKVVNDIEFSDIQFTETNGETLLIATIKNIGTERREMFAVNITLVDESGNEIKTIPGLISPLNPGETSQFSSSTTLNYVNAYDFKVTAK